MYERVRRQLYELLAGRGVRIEVTDAADLQNFCCLRIRYQQTPGMTLIVGRFTDDVLEVLLIAHEFGHIIHYENLSREDAEGAYCAIFASNHLGLENISPEAKHLVITIEKKASEYAISLLRTIHNDESFLAHARNTYDDWIRGYLKKAGLPEIDALAS